MPYVELAHAADIPYADVFVRLSEVDAKDRSHNVSDGFIRLGPTRSSPLRVDLDAVAHRFRAGHRIRLMVAGGSHPRFARNLGTGEPPLTARRLVRSTHTVAHGRGGTSRLVLPVVR
jgi:predicted acyl esterase